MIIRRIVQIMLFPMIIYAGSYPGSTEKDVTSDPESNLIYIGINEISKKDKIGYSIVNYMILNPTDGTKSFIFPKENQKTIKSILFETKYDSTEKRMILNFRNDLPYSLRINPEFVINNDFIEKRIPKDKMIIVINDGYDQPSEIWTCLKNGKNLTKISTVEVKGSWHLDIRNCKIRIVNQKGYETSINQYDW
ncbi:MAG: hypothetical protein JW913_06460 [Chitinispirillaceae bacterium]|nr:hypothetical protein [Chitinispirillaceae bacterium]